MRSKILSVRCFTHLKVLVPIVFIPIISDFGILVDLPFYSEGNRFGHFGLQFTDALVFTIEPLPTPPPSRPPLRFFLPLFLLFCFCCCFVCFCFLFLFFFFWFGVLLVWFVFPVLKSMTGYLIDRFRIVHLRGTAVFCSSNRQQSLPYFPTLRVPHLVSVLLDFPHFSDLQ